MYVLVSQRKVPKMSYHQVKIWARILTLSISVAQILDIVIVAHAYQTC